ncbi:alpha-N-arabinofuranosidase [Agromyces aerolatus]|uniref:alpha-N-arabinofuranosidase n=1 Tax=Agromyces sp. LY-1074 TaxID=3074080 RepID=UPI0028595648|nr:MULTISPECIES: alpha-L-arabinofuranosidase C-terminal domain-containing protein [unclassified Agromyces]MDR5699729.1 alpha-L-arabinofuranosidase C-terminal domain-containing protein [Agromyces sp. LY-1074]MDR5706025.1 alpha-L-arabinofuranosidase C-terminal domain-containing protein [Agromyces sp. LY-1358]
MSSARLTIHSAFRRGTVASELFGSFVEHMGRCVYGGIFDPESPKADADGDRTDVLELVRELGVTAVRYPGGNFVSGYRWEDGVGPVGDRPARLDLAWKTREPNTFGLHEFMRWCAKAGVEPIMALNLGTRGVDAARALLEYANGQPGTEWADRRIEHGAPDPFGIRYWCLGNEMDGPWQTGQKTAREYGRLARETAKAMKTIDPELRLIACGSSHERMATFGEWEREVLEETYPFVDYISLHAYYEPDPGDPWRLLEAGHSMDLFIQGVIATADSVKARLGESKPMLLAFDEWNIYDPARFAPQPDAWVDAGSPIIEGAYDALDAVVVGDLITTLLRHADRVRIAALAQLVNVLAPIMTTRDEATRQSIFRPFALLSRTVGGVVLESAISTRALPSERFGELPEVASAVVLAADRTGLTVSIVNRNPHESVQVALELADLDVEPQDVVTLTPEGEQSAALQMDRPGRVTLELPPASWTMCSFGLNVGDDAAA